MAVPPLVHRLRFMNALRTFAALWVVLAHCILWGGFPLWFPNPQLAVDLFMMLSGFLMVATVEAREHRQRLTAMATWLGFYIRRFFRLAPLYYVCLVVAVLTREWFVGGYQTLFDANAARWGGPGSHFNPAFTCYGFRSLAAHLTVVFGLSPQFVFSTMFGDWSLSLEMQFYLVFPALLLLARRFGFALVAVTLTAFGLLARHVAFEWYVEPGPLPFLLDYFVIGMLLHEAVARKRDWLVGLCLLIIGSDWSLYGRSVILMIPVVLVIWLLASTRMAALPGVGLVRRLLENRLFDVGADVSYGIYLIHGFFVSGAGLTLFHSSAYLALPSSEQFLIMAMLVVVGSVSVSLVAHRLIERPGIRLGALVSARVASELVF